MKAVTRSRYGGPEELEIAEVAAPTPEADEVLLHVEAVSVNAGDWHLLRGSPLFIRLLYGGLLRPNTAILGMDVAGRVAEVGTDVTRLDLEDRVFGALPDGVLGGFAEQAKAPADTLVPIPAGVSVEAAAAVPTTGMSALQALRDDGALSAGDDILVHGASGGVGSFAVQLARAMGATVTGVCSGAKVDLVESLGVDRVVDYQSTDVTAQGRRYDLIVDTAAAHSLRAYRRILKPGGRYVMVGGPAGRFVKTATLGPLLSCLGSRTYGTFAMTPNVGDLTVLADHLADGTVVPALDRTFTLAETADAIRYLEDGRARGKVVVTPGVPEE